jgi:hypothetical protein
MSEPNVHRSSFAGGAAYNPSEEQRADKGGSTCNGHADIAFCLFQTREWQKEW